MSNYNQGSRISDNTDSSAKGQMHAATETFITGSSGKINHVPDATEIEKEQEIIRKLEQQKEQETSWFREESPVVWLIRLTVIGGIAEYFYNYSKKNRIERRINKDIELHEQLLATAQNAVKSNDRLQNDINDNNAKMHRIVADKMYKLAGLKTERTLAETEQKIVKDELNGLLEKAETMEVVVPAITGKELTKETRKSLAESALPIFSNLDPGLAEVLFGEERYSAIKRAEEERKKAAQQGPNAKKTPSPTTQEKEEAFIKKANEAIQATLKKESEQIVNFVKKNQNTTSTETKEHMQKLQEMQEKLERTLQKLSEEQKKVKEESQEKVNKKPDNPKQPASPSTDNPDQNSQDSKRTVKQPKTPEWQLNQGLTQAKLETKAATLQSQLTLLANLQKKEKVIQTASKAGNKPLDQTQLHQLEDDIHSIITGNEMANAVEALEASYKDINKELDSYLSQKPYQPEYFKTLAGQLDIVAKPLYDFHVQSQEYYEKQSLEIEAAIQKISSTINSLNQKDKEALAKEHKRLLGIQKENNDICERSQKVIAYINKYGERINKQMQKDKIAQGYNDNPRNSINHNDLVNNLENTHNKERKER